LFNWVGAGASKALETAQIAILTERMNKATSDFDKRRAQWRITELLANQTEEVKDSAFLSSFTGTYQGGLVFYVSQSMLYCRNAERGNRYLNYLLFRATGLYPMKMYRLNL
jgi:hypothetical protein